MIGIHKWSRSLKTAQGRDKSIISRNIHIYSRQMVFKKWSQKGRNRLIYSLRAFGNPFVNAELQVRGSLLSASILNWNGRVSTIWYEWEVTESPGKTFSVRSRFSWINLIYLVPWLSSKTLGKCRRSYIWPLVKIWCFAEMNTRKVFSLVLRFLWLETK